MFNLSKLAFWRRESSDTAPGRPLEEAVPYKPRIGLALSSGGARGLAHVGVLEVLEEAGIEIHAIAGSSMGAYVGSLWAAGFSGKQLEDLAKEMQDRRQMWKLADPLVPPLKGLFRGEKAKRHLARSIGDLKFEDLERRLMVITFDLDTCERLVVRSGTIVDAVHASCAMPGVIAPVSFKGRHCADGGVVDPVPVGALRRYGDVDKIIAVSTLPTLAEVEAGACRPDDGSNRNWWRRGLGSLNAHANPLATGNLVDTFRKSVRAAQIRLAEESCRRADLCLHPPYVPARWHEYSRFEQFVEAGRKIALAHLDEIRAMAEGLKAPSILDDEPDPDNLVVGQRVA